MFIRLLPIHSLSQLGDNKKQICFVLIVAGLVTSCSEGTLAILYNRTPNACQVLVGKKTYELNAHSTVAFCPVRRAAGDFFVIHNGQTNANRIAEVRIPRGFINMNDPQAPISLQMETDWKIFLIHSTNALPTLTLPAQPEGFPLRPTESEL